MGTGLSQNTSGVPLLKVTEISVCSPACRIYVFHIKERKRVIISNTIHLAHVGFVDFTCISYIKSTSKILFSFMQNIKRKKMIIVLSLFRNFPNIKLMLKKKNLWFATNGSFKFLVSCVHLYV